jgi:hypothetical protein
VGLEFVFLGRGDGREIHKPYVISGDLARVSKTEMINIDFLFEFRFCFGELPKISSSISIPVLSHTHTLSLSHPSLATLLSPLLFSSLFFLSVELANGGEEKEKKRRREQGKVVSERMNE